MKTQWNWIVILVILLGLAFAGPEQPVSAQASGVGIYTFTSSPNPSPYSAPVTISLSATGTDPDSQPFGYVYFFDNDKPICGRGELNMVWGYVYSPDTPVTCTLSSLEPGTHVITAEITSLIPHVYPDELLTLEGGHTVIDPYPLVISPETLPDGRFGEYYDQTLAANCQEGVPCEAAIYWELKEGSLPAGVYYLQTGQIFGNPSSAGSFAFSVEANNYAGSTGSRDYSLTILQATPVIVFNPIGTDGGMTWLSVRVNHSNRFFPYQPSGRVSFFFNDVPLEGCTDLAFIPDDGMGGNYFCRTGALSNLAPGNHTIRADFSPDDTSAANYTGASGSIPFNVLPRVEGMLFEDLDQDGVHDDGEGPVGGYVDLDQGCDGIQEIGTYASSYTGLFSVEATLGQEYCLTVNASGNFRQATPLEPFTVDGNNHFDIAFHRVQLAFDPLMLPHASVGMPYSQVVTIEGGKPPYTQLGGVQNLPDGLTLDLALSEAAFSLSGTPTAPGIGYLYLAVQDADGMVGEWSSSLFIKTDGAFTLASFANPSNTGEEVTFTCSGSSNEVDPEMDPPGPPYGTVSFFDGETPIPNCQALLLNIDPERELHGEFPAICRTSSLTEGAHTITAVFTDQSGVYHDATLTLSQQVTGNNPPVADPGGPYLGAINAAIQMDGSKSSDPDGDALKYTWDFGDGNAGTDATSAHLYASAGIYDVCLTVNDGLAESAPACTIAVVYDLAAGFVTGGGWINSPAGAYREEPGLSGKATFGFISKYQKNAKTPVGNIEFQLEAGSFAFHSTAYQRLIVNKAGSNAQFKGAGLVNGWLDPNGNEFKFMLWATDGDRDTFRIRVWWEGNDSVEHVVYDNGVEQVIGGGSIIVHAGKK